MFLMSDILPEIRDLASMEIEDLGGDPTTQNTAIFRIVSTTLREMAKQANIVEWSDALNITTNGYQTFVRNTAAITDMFMPICVYDVSGTRERPTEPRSTFAVGNGWYRESDNKQVHTYGLTGNHKLQYIRYPAPVAAQGDAVELPLASQRELVFLTVSTIKLVKNFYQESEHIRGQANTSATIKASMAATGKIQSQPTEYDGGA